MKGIINAAGVLWVGVLIIVIGLSVAGGSITKMHMDMAANHVSQMIESNGVYDATEASRVASYLKQTNINAAISVTSDTADVSSMSLGDNFSVKLTPDPFGIGAHGLGFVLVPISGSADGISGVYRK